MVQVVPPLMQWLTEPTSFLCALKVSVEPKVFCFCYFFVFHVFLQTGTLLQPNVFSRWVTYLFSVLLVDIVRLHQDSESNLKNIEEE